MLTDVLIRNAKPKDRPYKLPKELGLGLIVDPDGSKGGASRTALAAREPPTS
jgi:hypothetical protein